MSMRVYKILTVYLQMIFLYFKEKTICLDENTIVHLYFKEFISPTKKSQFPRNLLIVFI